MAEDLGTLRATITGDTRGLRRARERAKGYFRGIAKEARVLDKITGFATLRKGANLLTGALGTLLKSFSRFIARLRIFIAAAGVALGSLVALRQELVAVAAAAGGVATALILEGPRERLKSVGETAQFVRQEMEVLRSIANEFGQRVTALAGGFSKLIARGKEAGVSLNRLRTITEGVVASGDALGRTGQDINKTLETFSGLVQNDRIELRELASALDFTNDKYGVLADALGKTEDQIRDLIENNATLSNQSLVAVSQQLRDTSDNSVTLSGAFNRLFNTVTKLLQIFNQTGVIDAMIEVLGRLRNALRSQGVIEAILRLGQATAEWIRGLPAVVQSIRDNWNSILDAITTVAGTLIGTATGGPLGGVIGAVIASNDALRNSFFETLGAAAKFAFQVTKALNGVEVDSKSAQRVADWLNNVKEGIATIIQQVQEGNLKKSLSTLLGGVIDTFINDFTSKLSGAVVDAIVNGVQEGFKSAKETIGKALEENVFGGGGDRNTVLRRDPETGDLIRVPAGQASPGGQNTELRRDPDSGDLVRQPQSSGGNQGSSSVNLPRETEAAKQRMAGVISESIESGTKAGFDELSRPGGFDRSLESLRKAVEEKTNEGAKQGLNEPFKDLAEPGGFDQSPQSLRITGRLRQAQESGGFDAQGFNIQTENVKKQGRELERVSQRVLDLANNYGLAVEQAKRLVETSDQIGETVASGFIRAIQEGENLKDVLNDVLKQIRDIILKRTVGNAISNAVSQGVASLSGSFANTGTSTSTQGVGSATPRQFAEGGVATEASIFGEGKQAEAAVPLPDGRSIPVNMQGGQGDVVVNIINQGGEQLESKQKDERKGPNNERVIDVMVASSIKRLDSQGQLDFLFNKRGAKRQGNF